MQSPPLTFDPNNEIRKDLPPSVQPYQMSTMSGSEMPVEADGTWNTPTSSGMRPRPATIHEGFSYGVENGYQGLPGWTSAALPMYHQQQHTPSDTASSRPISVHQDLYSPTTMEHGKFVSCLWDTGWS